MSLPFGQQAMVHVARVFAPLTNFMHPVLGENWAFIPAFAIFFLQVFSVSLLWLLYVKVHLKKAPFIASCAMSSIHAMVCVLSGYVELQNWGPLHLDIPNTPVQSLQLQFSMGYLIADTLYFLLFAPNDLLFLGHHALSGLYLFSSLKLGLGGISAIFVFFMGEITSPLFNIFSVAKELKHDHPLAARVLEYTSPIFTFSFVLVRSIISPVLIGWFLYTLWFQSPRIPAPWRIFMGILVAIGLAGSQLWSYKLIAGFRKVRRAAKAKKAELKEE